MESWTKLAMTRTRIDNGDEGMVDPNQIWVRARTMRSGSRRHTRMGEARARPPTETVRDGRGTWRWLEAMRSGGGAVALRRRMKTMDGEKKTRRYIFGGSLVPGEAMARD